MRSNISQIILTVVITAIISVGVLYLWQYYKQGNPELFSQQIELKQDSDKKFQEEEGFLHQFLTQKNYFTYTEFPTPEYADSYKVFDVIPNPSLQKKAVLFGVKSEGYDCCVRGVFFISGDTISEDYGIVGNFGHEALGNFRWKNETTFLYNGNIVDELGSKTSEKTVQVN